MYYQGLIELPKAARGHVTAHSAIVDSEILIVTKNSINVHRTKKYSHVVASSSCCSPSLLVAPKAICVFAARQNHERTSENSSSLDRFLEATDMKLLVITDPPP